MSTHLDQQEGPRRAQAGTVQAQHVRVVQPPHDLQLQLQRSDGLHGFIICSACFEGGQIDTNADDCEGPSNGESGSFPVPEGLASAHKCIVESHVKRRAC